MNTKPAEGNQEPAYRDRLFVEVNHSYSEEKTRRWGQNFHKQHFKHVQDQGKNVLRRKKAGVEYYTINYNSSRAPMKCVSGHKKEPRQAARAQGGMTRRERKKDQSKMAPTYRDTFIVMGYHAPSEPGTDLARACTDNVS